MSHFEIPGEEEWEREVDKIKAHYAFVDTYEIFTSWLERANKAIARRKKLVLAWEKYETSLQKKNKGSWIVSAEMRNLIRKLPDIHFRDWKHALIVISKKKRLKQYERVLIEIETFLRKQVTQSHEENRENIAIRSHTVFSIHCPTCGVSLGATTPYGFVLREQWKSIPRYLSCPGCKKVLEKPANPWKENGVPYNGTLLPPS